MVFTRPLELIVSEMQREIQATLPNANLLPGSAIREAFINPSAAQIALLTEAVEATRIAQTISEATGTDLDRLAANFGLARDPGRQSIGQITLILSSAINVQTITINDGTTVATDETLGLIEFSTIGTHSLRPVDRDFFAAEAQRAQAALAVAGITNATHIFEVPIQSVRAGSTGNVGAFTIIRGNIPGVDSIVNLTGAFGGSDAESDDSLRRRISLALSGTSTGTEEGLIATALANPTVTDAIVVRPGDPLMTRDGSIFDDEGNLVMAGSGRAVDLYVRGAQFVTNTETFTFVDNEPGVKIVPENNLILGFDDVDADNIFSKQPISQLLQLTGSVTGNNLAQAREVRDDEGNVILVGNYTLLRDAFAEDLQIVKNNETGATEVATFLSPTSNRYSVLQTLESSGKGNSALGQDAVFFITNVATVTEEVVTRGSEFNGSDALAFPNVALIQVVTEDVVITKESIVISEQGIENDVFVITTKHRPLVSVESVRHSRLGFEYDFEILDGAAGTIRLIGRFAPQEADIIQVSYTWRQPHLQDIEFFSQGDTVKWAREPFERPQTEGQVLLAPTTLLPSLDLQIQPLIPAYLGLEANQLTARSVYTMTITGDKARIVVDDPADHDPTLGDGDLVFNIQAIPSTTASSTRLGRVVSVQNLTQGFEYNLENMALNTNLYDPSIRVDESLANSQFLLDGVLNARNLEVGDKLLLSRKTLLKHWTSTGDFTNNIDDNIAPTFDPIITSVENDEVTVKRQEDNTDAPQTILAGSVTSSGTLSGIVEISDDVTIESGVTVILQPDTVIRFRDSSSLESTEIVQELSELNNTITDLDIETATDIEENDYIFEQPEGTTAPFFIILSDDGTESLSIFFDRDIIRQVVEERDAYNEPSSFTYFINERPIEPQFIGTPTGSGLLAAIDTSGIFLGYRRDNGDDTTTFVSIVQLIDGRLQYGLPLTNTPRVTGLAADDFSYFQASNPDAIFTDTAYDDGRNLFLIDGLATESSYLLEYFVNIIRRLNLRVRGTLQTATDVTEDRPVVFTSTAEESAPGDWEGIIFEPPSRTGAPGNAFVTSFLTNCVIKNARIGIQNNTSDPLIDRCLIKNCLEGAYVVNSSFFQILGFTESDLRILSNDFDDTGRATSEFRTPGGDGYGYGYGGTISTKTLSFPIVDLLTTSIGEMPPFIKVGTPELLSDDVIHVANFNGKFIVNMVLGTDYEVFIDGVAVVPGEDLDFALEYDVNQGGFILSIFNTQLTQDFLTAHAIDPNIITIDYYAVFSNGAITNSILTNNGNAAVDINSTAFVRLENNTIDDNGFHGITVADSYANIKNNIITDWAIAPILHDEKSVVAITTNDMFSQPLVNTEQNEIAEIDSLVLTIDENDAIITVATPSLYARNTVFKIDDEFFQVADVLGDRLSVIRGFGNTTPAEHEAGADVFIQRIKVIFIVTGIPGNFCQVREVGSDGSLIPNREPVDMLKIDNNTFRISFSVDRSADFFYRFQFKEELSDPTFTITNTRRLFTFQFGSCVNNFINPNQEQPISVGSNDSTNYCDDPLFGNAEVEDFSLATDSPANILNPFYATPFDPSEPRLRFLGRRDVVQPETLLVGTSTIILSDTPIVTVSLATDVTIALASNPSRTLLAASYDDTTKTVTLSAPVASTDVGAYTVSYATPINLGTTISPYPLNTTINIQYNENRTVDFTKLEWRESGDAGNIRSRFKVANSTDELAGLEFSDFVNESPFDLSLGTGTFPRGTVIEFEMNLQTNDAGFASDGTPLFPKLQDISLFLTPARDDVLYKVLDLSFDTRDLTTVVTIEDDENVGFGIRTSTFTTVGSGDALSAIARKAEDNFDEALEFVIGESDAITIGATELRIKGDVTLARSVPGPNDEVLATFILVDVNDGEEIVFIEAGTQITKNRYFFVNNIVTSVIVDKVSADLTSENLAINSLAQPVAGSQYLTSYTFAAPSDGEAITVSYTANDTIRTLAQQVEVRRVLTADVLTRAAFQVDVRIEANILISSGFSANAVIVDITNALNNFFAGFSSFGGTILISDIQSTMTSVTGVTSATINVLSRTPEVVVQDIVMNDREFAALATNNPVLTVALATNPNNPIASNSL